MFRATEIAAAVGGTLHGDDIEIDGAAIDSRALRAGQLFVPVRGERDGHDFIDAAQEAGAAAALRSRSASVDHLDGFSIIEVDDAELALRSVGEAARGRLRAPVVGITGSVGKTSTKDLLVSISGRSLRVSANEKSFNNELGVPLTLVNADADSELVIIEMGARGAGHIADLCAIADPTIGVVTAVELAHAEFMGGIDGIAAAKRELIEHLPASGVAVLSFDNPLVAAMGDHTDATVVRFGLRGGEVRAVDVTLDDDLRPRFRLESDWGSIDVVQAVRGRHQVGNALAAAAVAFTIGVPLDDIAAGLGAAELSPWRMELRVTPSGARVLNDAYNAGPASMEAALRALAELPAVNHIAVLGLMAELGEESTAAHRRIAEVADSLGIRLLAFGDAEYGADVERVDDVPEALAALGDLTAADAVLVKGSRVAGLERLADALLD